MAAQKKLVIGLGNPSPEFEGTYHNVGAAAVRAIAHDAEFKRYKKLFTFAIMGDLAFVIPLTFMNESGAAAKEAMKKFGVSSKDLIVIHDESDLALGKYKISMGRGAAGHKGVQSIMDALRANDFTRIRIGIRDADEKKRKKASAFVLKKISAKDGKVLADVFASL